MLYPSLYASTVIVAFYFFTVNRYQQLDVLSILMTPQPFGADDDSFHSKPISFYLTLFPSYSLFHIPPQPTPIYFQNLSFHRLKEQITMMEQLNRRDTHTHTHKTHTHHDSCFKEFGKDFCTTACDCWLGYSREYSKGWVTVESTQKSNAFSLSTMCGICVVA